MNSSLGKKGLYKKEPDAYDTIAFFLMPTAWCHESGIHITRVWALDGVPLSLNLAFSFVLFPSEGNTSK
jgi:hypothetical protein